MTHIERLARYSWLIYFGIAGLGMLPGLLIGPSLDASVFSTVGWRIAEGDVLYSSVWDHKPPGMFAPALFAHLTTDTSENAWFVVWTLSVASVAITAWLVERILVARAIGLPAQAAGALTAFVLSAYLLTLGGGLGETFATVPSAMAVAMVATNRDGAGRWVITGLLVGGALVISLQALSVVAIVGVFGLSVAIRTVVTRALGVVVGIVFVIAAAWGGLAVSGASADAMDALIAYSAAYRDSATSAAADAPAGSFLLPWVFFGLLPLVVPGSLAFVGIRRRPEHRELLLGAGAFVVLWVFSIAVQGRLYGHYALSVVIPLGLLAGIGIDGAWRRLSTGRGGRIIIGGAIVAAATLSMVVGAIGAAMEQSWIGDSNQRVESVAPVVRGMTAPVDDILVWGNEPLLYERSERAPAIRYVYLYPLITKDYVTPALVERIIRELIERPPAVVIDAGSPGPGRPGLPPLLIERPVATDGRDFDLLDPLRRFVRERYVYEATVAGWPIYRLDNEVPP